MYAGPHAAFARTSTIASGGLLPPATLSAFPGKPYGKIRLLTYISIFQVSRVVPGEQARHTALLSLGATLSRPCRLPPLPPPSRFVPSMSPSIPRILRQPGAHPHPARALDERVQPRKAHASSRSLAHRHDRSPDALYDSQNTHWQCPYRLVYQQRPPARYDFFSIFV